MKTDDLARIKMLRVSPRDLIGNLTMQERKPIKRAFTLPDEWTVKDIHYNSQTRSYEVYIWRMEFDVVKQGAMCPEIESVTFLCKEYDTNEMLTEE